MTSIPEDAFPCNGTQFKAIAFYLKNGGDPEKVPKFAEGCPDMVKMAKNPPPGFDDQVEFFAKALNLENPTDKRVTEAVGYQVAKQYLPSIINNEHDRKSFEKNHRRTRKYIEGQFEDK